jgi:hypothetical protein
MKTRFIVAPAAVMLVVVGFFGWRWHYRQTPEYALSQIRSAIRDHNRLRFQTYVDMDRLVPAVVDQVVGYALLESFSADSSNGLAALGAAVGTGLANQMKPALTQALRSAVLEAVETGSLDSLYSAPADTSRQVDLAVFSRSTGATAESFEGLSGIQREGDAASVGFRFRQEALDTSLVVHLRMERNQGRWRIVSPDDLDQYLKALAALRQAYVSARNASISQELDSLVQWDRFERRERHLAYSNYILISRTLHNRSDKPLHHIRLWLKPDPTETGELMVPDRPLVAPGGSTTLRTVIDYNQFMASHRSLRTGDLDGMATTLTLVADTGDAAQYVAPYDDWDDYIRRTGAGADFPRRPEKEAPSSAASVIEDLAGWQVSETRNPLTDSPLVTLVLQANSGGLMSTPALVLRCRDNKTEVYINWNQYLGSDDLVRVTSRVGTGKASTDSWPASTDNEATFYPASYVGLIKRLINADRFVAQVTPYNESPVTAVFELAGLSEKVTPLRRACHW